MITLATAATDNPLNTLALLGGILAPFLGVGAGILASWFSRRTGREQVTVSAAAVKVDEKEAHTAEIAMIIDGFSASLKQAQQDLTAARSDLERARDELKTARLDNDDLRRRVVAYGRQLTEMLFHIINLEQMVPNPPGPPTRPDWEPWPAHFDDTEPTQT